jgi:hypothetical protein
MPQHLSQSLDLLVWQLQLAEGAAPYIGHAMATHELHHLVVLVKRRMHWLYADEMRRAVSAGECGTSPLEVLIQPYV